MGSQRPGATGRIRTGDLLITNQLLYRLSHSSKLNAYLIDSFFIILNPKKKSKRFDSTF